MISSFLKTFFIVCSCNFFLLYYWKLLYRRIGKKSLLVQLHPLPLLNDSQCVAIPDLLACFSGNTSLTINTASQHFSLWWWSCKHAVFKTNSKLLCIPVKDQGLYRIVLSNSCSITIAATLHYRCHSGLQKLPTFVVPLLYVRK